MELGWQKKAVLEQNVSWLTLVSKGLQGRLEIKVKRGTEDG